MNKVITIDVYEYIDLLESKIILIQEMPNLDEEEFKALEEKLEEALKQVAE